jgi:hypothetical protein
MPTGRRSPISELELIELHVRTLYTHDDDGRLVAVNVRRRPPAARFFLGRTARDVIWRVRHDLPADLVAQLAALAEAEPVTADLERPPACLAAVRAALAIHGPPPDPSDDGGPEYWFPDVIAAPPGPAAVAVTDDNAGILQRWLPEWIPDVSAQLPIRVVVIDGAAVAICACVRWPGQATHAGVETHPAFRGHGYAAIATAAWAQAMRDRDIIPLYGTSWTNRASQRVAARLGLIRYGASLSID